ncbi:hypothetical protein ACOMHN_063389 [Nucella lapillus]
MDLEGVRHKLTEGYARINRVKNSTTKIEECRTKLKAKGDKAISEVKAMMTCIAQKLYQLHQSIESTIENTVAEREAQLDAKKKEIHDGYANLVKICVEADNVIRGKKVNFLGTSFQPLFCKFEAANLKLDAAEKLDVEGLIGFEFKDDSKQFLSNVYVARLQHFNRYGRLAEIDEFWLDYQNTDDFLDRKNETTYTVSVPCLTDCPNSRPATVRRSPDRNASFSPKQCLETIQEVPEDSSPMKGEKIIMKTRVQTPTEVVRISEEELYAGKCHCCSESGMNSYSEPALVPPPPGFSRLKEPGLEMTRNLQHYAHLQKKLGPKLGINRNVQADGAVCSTNGSHEGALSSKVSKSDASFVDVVRKESTGATFKPVGSHSVSSQNYENNLKFDRDRVLTKPSEKYSYMEDFVWDSDESVEVHGAGSCSSYHAGLRSYGQHKEGSKGDRLNGRSSRKNIAPQTKTVVLKTEEKPPCSESDCEDDHKRAFSLVSSLSSNGQQSADKPGDSVIENIDRPQEQNTYHGEPNQNGSAQKDVRATDYWEPKQNGYAQKDFTPTDIKKETGEVADEEKQSAITYVDVRKREGRAFNKSEEKFSPGKKATFSPAEESKDRGGGTKTPEVPRPVKTKSRRLDLAQMLHHTGGGVSVIHAKCIEKIRGDFDHPIGVCTNSKGDVIVADTSNHLIKVCNNGRVIKKFGSDLKMRRPSAVVVNDKDEVFVKDNNCLYHFDAEGQFIKTMGKRAMNAPYGLGLTKERKLIVVDALYSNGRMHVFQQNGAMDTYPYQPLRSQQEDSKCRFLAVHGDSVLTSDLGRSCLYLTNQKGELNKTLGWRGKRYGELNEPAGVAADSMGNWVVADSKNHRVQVFSENGHFMAAVNFIGESIRRPSGIHLTSDGLLYVINYLESVIKVFKLGTS